MNKKKIDQLLSVCLIIVIIGSIAVLIHIITTPVPGEKFTEFYILGPGGKAEDYPQNIEKGENISVILGIANHQYRTVHYVVEVWLVNSTMVNTTHGNETRINHMYYMDSFELVLNHTDIDSEKEWSPQWERPYNLTIEREGPYKLWFLLLKDRKPELPALPEGEDFANTTAKQRIINAMEGNITSLNLNIRVSG